MSAINFFIVLFPILIAGAALLLLRLQSRSSEKSTRSTAEVVLARPANRRRVSTGTTRISRSGAPTVSDVQQPVQKDTTRVIIIAVLLFGLFVYLLSRTMTPRSDDFIVLVAPFADQGAAVTQTGHSAAQRLAALLPVQSGRRIRVVELSEAPADNAAAVSLLTARGADILVWGDITPGALLDSESLIPHIAYLPSGGFAPNAWVGYTGRFALPSIYRLSETPINGEVVLPQLFLALADYSDNNIDQTVAILRQLQRDYPALNTVLPNLLLGNIDWARAEYGAAVDDYQAALRANQAGDALTQAQLYNNLGAVLQDAGDIRARDAFNQAISLLNANGADLAELRYNLSVEALNAHDYTLAADSLERAYSLQRPPSMLMLELSKDYLLSGRTGPLQSDSKAPTLSKIINDVESQVVVDLDRSPATLRDVEHDRLHAGLAFVRSLQSLSQLTGLSGPLSWKLEARDNLNQSTLSRLENDLDQAANMAQQRIRRWSEKATALDASGQGIAGQIAIHQARLAEHDQRLFQKWRAMVMVELAQSHGAAPPQGVASVWSRLQGNSTSVSEIQDLLNKLIKVEQRDVELTMLRGYALLTEGQFAAANDAFRLADAQLPQHPEPSLGLARVALANTDVVQSERYSQAQKFLQQAIAYDASFFPARIFLADIAEKQGNWQLAIEQRRQLYQEQPGETTALALVRTLRQSGANNTANIIEAEQILLPLANDNSVEALLELSKVYSVAQNTNGMRDALERAQHIEPRNVEVAYALGLIAFESKPADLSEAERQFRLALNSDSHYVPALLRLAELHASDSKTSTEFYRRALEAGAKDVDTLNNIGINLLAHQEPKLAKDAFAQAAKADDKNAQAYWGLAEANLTLEQLDASEKAAQTALGLQANNFPEALVIIGDVALARGQLDAAERAYLDAIAQNGQLVRPHIGLGRLAVVRGQWSVATGHFRNAMAGRDDMWKPEAYFWLGEALLRQQNLNEAIQAYQQALDWQPDYPEAWFGLAQAYALAADLEQRQGRPQQAAQYVEQANKHMDQALLYRPKYAEVFLLRGKMFEQAGSHRQALNAYSDAIDANGKLSEARYRRALLLIQDNKLKDAQKDLDAAVAAQPVFPEARYWLGRLAFADTRYEQALEQFKQAVAQAAANGQNYAEARFYQGLTEERLGLRDAAIASIQASLQENTNSSWAGEARTALDRLSQP